MIEDQESLIQLDDQFIVILDSRNATINNSPLSYNSDLTFRLQEAIIQPVNSLNFKASVLSFTCPNSQYVINNLNNYLGINISGDGDHSQYYIEIPKGNYNVLTFQTEFISSINFIMAYYGVSGTFTMTYSTSNYKYTLTHSNFPFYIDQTLLLPSNNPQFSLTGFYTIGDIMGFDDTTRYTATSNSFPVGSYSLIFPYTTNFGGLNNLNIHIENIKTHNVPYIALNKIISVLNQGTNQEYANYSKQNVAISIPVNCNPNETIYYQKLSSFDFSLKEETIDHLRITLRDDLGNLLQLNNQNWNMTIQFTLTKLVQKKSRNFFSILQNPFPTFE
jgi:hypothetical protein